jgi:hypothetical protein
MDDRWTPRKREVAQLAICGGLITIEQAMKFWHMTYEELDEWGIRNEHIRIVASVSPADRQPRKFIRVGRVYTALNDTDRRILELLSNHKGKVVTPRMISRVLYAERIVAKTRTIDVFIMRLRRRLHAHRTHVTVRTIWGRGYLLCDLGSPGHRAVA